MDALKKVIVQISTPLNSGTGFYVEEFGLIVTNFHVVKGNEEVVVGNTALAKAVTEVVYYDAVYDLAFLKVPEAFTFNGVPLAKSEAREGEGVIAIGHPFGLQYTITQGIVSRTRRLFQGIAYLQVDAAINPGNSGGPLFNEKGEIIGVNTFIISNGENLGFSLPVAQLEQAFEDYRRFEGQKALRCNSCHQVIAKDSLDNGYCSNCGQRLDKDVYSFSPFEPVGTIATIENIISNLGRDVRLARCGNATWEIEQGSARIRIIYNQTSRFIVADATLCRLPRQNISDCYAYLLEENHDSEGLVFSVNNNDILLSLLIFDEDLSLESATAMFSRLLQKADDYDDVLINRYGALPVEKEIN